MKIRFLGTAAAEGFPAVFCNCEYCNKARELGGKNIRTRSQSLIDNKILIDFPSDTYAHFLSNGIKGHEIEYLFITHPHVDHLSPDDLYMRQGAFAHNMKVPTLKVYGTKASIDKIPENYKNISLNTIDLFETVKFDGYEITALPARHMARDVSVIYIIKGDKTILYAHDTGFLFDEVLDYFKDNKIYFDMVTLDCTNGVIVPITDEGGHMGFDNCERLIKKLEEIGAIDSNTIKYFNHFSHNVNPLQEELEKVATKIGVKISYDGLEVEV